MAEIYETKQIVIKNVEETVIEYDGSKKPSAIFLNNNDQALVRNIVDNTSAKFLRDNISNIKDDMTKIVYFRYLYDEARDGNISIYQVGEIIAKFVPTERDETVIRYALFFIYSLLPLAPKPLKVNYLMPILFDSTLKAIQNFKDDKTVHPLLVNYLVWFASYGEKSKVDNVARLMGWLDGTDAELKDFELSNANKWDIVIAIHKYPVVSNSTREAYFNKVAETDSSDEM
mmetsp:Transcript_1555/g.1355  ORF Transcript_1555/g.1355 Transcript_1555/m.1355 type:complete len:230 (-) Transcript_1555:315-1004(-)